MQVKVASRVYRMTKEQYRGLLKVAKEQVPLGIYAVERKDYAELRNDRCESVTQAKHLRKTLRNAGYKVYANGI